MKVSYLLNILVCGVCNIDQLPVGEVGKKVPIGYRLAPSSWLPLVAWGQCGMLVVCCGVWVGPVGMEKMTNIK